MTRSGRRGLIIASVLVIALLGVGLVARRAGQPSSSSVLEVVLDDAISDLVPENPIGSIFSGRTLSTRDYVEAILRAKDDPRITGLLLTIETPSAGVAKIQEIREAIKEFRAAGKWTVAWTETAGEFGPGTGLYYLATACDTIWLAPPGDVNLTGLRAEVPFIRGALDKLKVFPDYDQRGKYKNAMNFFTHTAMTDAHRESMEALVDGMYRQIRQGIAESRKMTDDEVAALIDKGPFVGPKALEAHLVDRLGYRDELIDGLRQKNGGHLPIVKTRHYLKSGRFWDHGARIALILGVGTVGRGESSADPISGSMLMGSDTVAQAIRDARADDSVRAIILRVDSPGGSYVASDVIWREVKLTKGVKPVVVSMSDVAASGGYFVSMAADRIIAEPGTITASIGVLSGKFVTRDMWAWLGITSDAVQRGHNASFFSGETKFTDDERVRFGEWLDRIYKDFVTKVADGRGKTFDEVHAIAQGRVWIGEDALKLGLVDEMGGLETAVRRAAELAHVPAGAPVELVEMPARKSFLQELWSRDDDAAATVTALRRTIRGVIEDGRLPGTERGVLELPFVPLIR
jgi:protease IV